MERDAEKQKFSPKGLIRGSLTPMNHTKTDTMSNKSVAMYSTIKDSTQEPQPYNDFLNDIFTVKKH